MSETESGDGSLARLLRVLDLFDEQHLLMTAEGIAQALQVSLPTAYRYLKQLAEAGLLQRHPDGTMGLGPRIIMLDHLIRLSDPLLQAALPAVAELAQHTGLDVVISRLYGDRLVDTHRETARQAEALAYGRGRPRPLFLGAAPKVILAQLSSPALRRLFDRQADARLAAGLPSEWPAFRQWFKRIRLDGFYLSRGELEPHLSAMAVPLIHPSTQEVLGALTVVTRTERLDLLDTRRLGALLQRQAQAIGQRLPADPRLPPLSQPPLENLP